MQILLHKNKGFLKESCKLVSKYAMTKTIQKKVRFAQFIFSQGAGDYFTFPEILYHIRGIWGR